MNREAQLLRTVAKVGGADEMTLVFELLKNDALGESRRAAVLEGLVAAADRSAVPRGDLQIVANWFDHEATRVASPALRLAGAWKLAALEEEIVRAARDSERAAAVRHAAIAALAALGSDTARAQLIEMSGDGNPTTVRQQAIGALVPLDLSAAAKTGAKLLASDRDCDAADLVSILLAQKGGAEALTKELATSRLDPDTAKIGIRTARASGRDVSGLVTAFQSAGQISSDGAPATAEQVIAVTQAVTSSGDAVRGEAVYRRRDLACIKCHSIAGAGGLVGPDLLSVGASAPVDYLVESILLPNKAVKENYHATTVLTDEGRIYSGIPVRRNDEELVLRDSEDREQSIPIGSIEEQSQADSLMPAGLANELTRAELVDLVSFLSELGKPGCVRRRNPARRTFLAGLAAVGRIDGATAVFVGRNLGDGGSRVQLGIVYQSRQRVAAVE